MLKNKKEEPEPEAQSPKLAPESLPSPALQVSEKRLEKLQVKLKGHEKFKEVWNSKHTGSRTNASIWSPTDLQGKVWPWAPNAPHPCHTVV